MKPAISTYAVRTAFAAIVALSLTACGTDTSKTEGSTIAIGIAKELANRVAPGKKQKGAATPDPERLAASAKASFSGPIIVAQMEKTGLLTALGEIGRNAGVRTYVTPSEQSIMLKQGLIVGTRGLGNDLMSADLGSAAAMVAGRTGGQTRRVWRYLDGEGIERPLPMTCTISRGPAKSFSFAGNAYNTVQMDESCAGQGLQITNSYWVTGSGTIALSHQWIGPALGHVTIQLVRN